MSTKTSRCLTSTEDVFANEGRLSSALTGYQVREGQQQMARAVEHALAQKQTLLIEAPTGVGKTFAYLVPALLQDKKVIVSTATKTLQDQLFFKDLPLILNVLGVQSKVALLKGRNNYMCHYRLTLNLTEGRFQERNTANKLYQIEQWAFSTDTGDLNELSEITESTEAWSLATSTQDNCLGQECPYIADCFLHKARKKAMQADLVVVNHHLLFADRNLKEEGFGELLPGVNAVILDEAHQIPEIASRFFGETLSGNTLYRLASDTYKEWESSAKDMAELSTACDNLEFAVKNTRLSFEAVEARGPWSEVASQTRIILQLENLEECLEELVDILELAAERDKGLSVCYTRAKVELKLLQSFLESNDTNYIKWYEVFNRSFILHKTPLQVAAPFQELLATEECAWIFTSATLTVSDKFDFYKDELGFNNEVLEEKLESPFLFNQQGICFVPRGLPDVSSREYTESCVEKTLPIIEKLKGRTFFLFTSHKALKTAADLLRNKTKLTVLVQNEANRNTLLNHFRAHDECILLGTTSFWEGIDVRGESLSCVIIDKLPFVSPGDPVNQARIDAYKKQNKMPFMVYQLPKAVIMLKQGAGRLIRDINDKGVLVVCDPRLVAKDYGRIFIQSLPRLKRTRELKVVNDFIETELE